MPSNGSFYNENQTVYTETNPAGPADAPITSTPSNAPSSFYQSGTAQEAQVITGVQAFAPIAHQFLTGVLGTGVFSSAQPSFADISGQISADQIPPGLAVGPPTATTLGGVFSNAGAAHKWVSAINTDGSVTLSQPSFSDISGTLAASQLPAPSATTLGGVESFTAPAHQWLNAISTLGVPSSSQPSFADISGTVAASQLPLPSATTIGGVESAAAVAHQWIDSISTLGVPHLSQPAAADISGLGTFATQNYATPPAIGGTTPNTGSFSDVNVLGNLTVKGGGSVREVLTGNRTYFVSTTGSDSNNGLSAGAPFLTLQHAFDTIKNSLDVEGFTVTISIADGAYSNTSSLVLLSNWVGGGTVLFQGNLTTPANVTLTSTNGGVFVANSGPIGGVVQVKGFKGSATTTGAGIIAVNSPSVLVQFDKVDFGACYNALQVNAPGSMIQGLTNGSHTLSGNMTEVAAAAWGGKIQVLGHTVTISGTPAWSFVGWYAAQGGLMDYAFTTFTGGSPTGKRYEADTNAVINTNAGGASFFPGSVAGTTSTGGQYV